MKGPIVIQYRVDLRQSKSLEGIWRILYGWVEQFVLETIEIVISVAHIELWLKNTLFLSALKPVECLLFTCLFPDYFVELAVEPIKSLLILERLDISKRGLKLMKILVCLG